MALGVEFTLHTLCLLYKIFVKHLVNICERRLMGFMTHEIDITCNFFRFDAALGKAFIICFAFNIMKNAFWA
ncbi:hypothetical protein CFR78_12260 [Komagataeibacter rhaeticus]|nr:hypothetical protein SXCC_04500 [Gluconacetobacter sp. SXCC-1]PYD52950.1 hypothetical protein CFR78_12260 [Komagataeibacter rhaeticus]